MVLVVVGAFFLFMWLANRGTLVLKAGNPITLAIDGESFGEGINFEVKLAEGSHTLTATIVDFGEKKLQIDKSFKITKGKVTTLEVAKNPQVLLDSEPKGAEVFVKIEEERLLGKTPFKVEMPPGSYSFVFRFSGSQLEKGPIELTYDEEKIVDAFFGNPPKSGINENDSLIIDSTPQGLRVYDNGDLVGVTPVSFPEVKPFQVVSGDFSAQVPIVHKKQYVLANLTKAGLNLAVSKEPISSSTGPLVTKAGFFTAEVLSGKIRVDRIQADSIFIELPPYDTPLWLDSGVTTITFAALFEQNFVLATYDAISGAQLQNPSTVMSISEHTYMLQSEDGTTNRHFFVALGNLFEFSLDDMKCQNLGSVSPDFNLRRIGARTDFAVGVFSSNGKCIGLRAARYNFDFETPVFAGFVQNSHPDIFMFFLDRTAYGFNVGTGEIVWQLDLKRRIFSAAYKTDNDTWYVDLGDGENVTPIDAGTGEVKPEVPRKETSLPGLEKGGMYLGAIQQGSVSLVRNPDDFIMAIDPAGEPIWSLQAYDVLCPTAFNPNYEISSLYAVFPEGIAKVDLKTGKPAEDFMPPFISFPTRDTILCQDGLYRDGKKIVSGQMTASTHGNQLLINWTDGGSCLIMP